MLIVEEKEYKDFLNIWNAPVVDAEYSEHYEFDLGQAEVNIFRKGTWHVTEGGRGWIRRLLLGPEQEPHSGGGSSERERVIIIPFAGISVASQGKSWIKQRFARPYDKVYTLVATVITPVTTDFIDRSIKRITLPRIELPDIPEIPIYCYGCLNNDCRYGWFSLRRRYTACPKCGTTNIRLYTEDDRFQRVMWHRTQWTWRTRLGDWGIFNNIRDLVADAIAWTQYYLFDFKAAFMPVDLLFNYIEEIRNAFKQFRDNLQMDIDRTINRQIGEVEVRVNQVLRDLYSMWSLRRGYVPTPAVVRNIKNDSFEWYSHVSNMTIAYFGIGSRR